MPRKTSGILVLAAAIELGIYVICAKTNGIRRWANPTYGDNYTYKIYNTDLSITLHLIVLVAILLWLGVYLMKRPSQS